MEEKTKQIIEAILFAAGRSVSVREISMVLEKSPEEVTEFIENLKNEYKNSDRGMEIIKLNDSYQMCTKKSLYEYISLIFDKKAKPNLSNASLEILSIIAYNPNVTRAEIENIRGVSADACVYKLLEYGLIEEAGKLDLPGKPMSYKTTDEFLRMFGFTSLEELPELPRYKLDENKQIVIDDLINNANEENEGKIEDEQKNIEEKSQKKVTVEALAEAPMPAREGDGE